MDEGVAALTVHQDQVAQKVLVRSRDPGGPLVAGAVGVDAVALQGGLAAGEQPVGAGGAVPGQSFQHGAFVVAHQVDHVHAGDGTAVHQPSDDAGGIGAAIDVVADMQQQGGRDRTAGEIRGDGVVQVGQLPVASVDVTDGVDTTAGRQGGGRWSEFDHCASGLQG